MYLDVKGKLVIEVTTTALFRGQFVMKKEAEIHQQSLLFPPEAVNIKFELELIWSAATWNGPKQVYKQFTLSF